MLQTCTRTVVMWSLLNIWSTLSTRAEVYILFLLFILSFVCTACIALFRHNNNWFTVFFQSSISICFFFNFSRVEKYSCQLLWHVTTSMLVLLSTVGSSDWGWLVSVFGLAVSAFTACGFKGWMPVTPSSATTVFSSVTLQTKYWFNLIYNRCASAETIVIRHVQ